MNESNGALTESFFYILISLFKNSHGYGIMKNVESISNGRVVLGAGTLYGAIKTLINKGWIVELEQKQGDRKKEYIITDLGREAVKKEVYRLKELFENGEKVLSENID